MVVNRCLLMIALIGGILVLIGVFGTWTEGYLGGEEASLWDMRDPCVLTGGILVVVGVLAAWGLGMENLGAMIPVGGFLALVYTIQSCRTMGEIDADLGYAVALVITGSLMAIIGTLGTSTSRIKRKTSLVPRLRTRMLKRQKPRPSAPRLFEKLKPK